MVPVAIEPAPYMSSKAKIEKKLNFFADRQYAQTISRIEKLPEGSFLQRFHGTCKSPFLS
jgi:hypothetical protein